MWKGIAIPRKASWGVQGADGTEGIEWLGVRLTASGSHAFQCFGCRGILHTGISLPGAIITKYVDLLQIAPGKGLEEVEEGLPEA